MHFPYNLYIKLFIFVIYPILFEISINQNNHIYMLENKFCINYVEWILTNQSICNYPNVLLSKFDQIFQKFYLLLICFSRACFNNYLKNLILFILTMSMKLPIVNTSPITAFKCSSTKFNLFKLSNISWNTSSFGFSSYATKLKFLKYGI